MAITYVKKEVIATAPVTPAPAPESPPPLQLIAKPASLPWDDEPLPDSPSQNVLQALNQFLAAKGKVLKKGEVAEVLTLVSVNTKRSYLVLDWDPGRGRVRLKGEFNMVLNPHITERENSLYIPVWR